MYQDMKKLTFVFMGLFFLLNGYSASLRNTIIPEFFHLNSIHIPLSSVRQADTAPVANAGSDQTVLEGSLVTLNGSLSYDPDGQLVTYQWQAPKGITLNTINGPQPSFTAPKVNVDTTYHFLLWVNDGTMVSLPDQVAITIKKENKIPVAHAGADIVKSEGDTATLDGSRSYDPEGRDMTYIWTTLEGITVGANQNSKIPFKVPYFLKDTVLIISLVVNDGFQNSLKDEFTITVWHINLPPVAGAVKYRAVDEGTTTSLNGSLSYDPEKRPLTYKWTAPEGITLSSETDVKPTFLAPEVSKDTPYIFTLVVNDGMVDSDSEEVTVMVRQVNKAPVARAGVDFSVNELTSVVLDGALSTDDDGDPLKYTWTAPPGISLSSSNICAPTFTAPDVSKDTTYTFLLTVNDGTVDSPPSRVSITVRKVNKVPVANAVIFYAAKEGENVTLDGSLSYDGDGDSLVYKWTPPKGIVLTATTSARPFFTAPDVYRDTSYTFILMVNDGTDDSSPQIVTVAIRNIVKPTFFKVYPNPTTGTVFVEFNRNPDYYAKAIILNIAGNEVFRKEITERSGFQCDLSGFEDGFYILNIRDQNKQYNQKIILQRK